MTILTRYILCQLLIATSCIMSVLIAVVWLTQSMRLLDVLINRHVSFIAFLKLVTLLLPDLISITLPIGLLIAVLFTYYRLLVDNELIICRVAGMNNFRLIKPALMMSTGVIALLYTINLYFLPLAFQNLRDLEFSIRNKVNIQMIQAGEFNSFKDIMVYINHYKKDGSMAGILIYDARNPQHTYAITAESGQIIDTKTGTHFILIKGSRQENNLETGAPSILSFDQYAIDLNRKNYDQQVRPRKPYERFLNELFAPQDSTIDLSTRKKFNIEAHQRLVLPWTSLIFTLIALTILLKADYNRRGRGRQIFIALGLCGCLEGTLLMLLYIGENFTFSIPLVYFVVILSIVSPLRYLQSTKQSLSAFQLKDR